MNCKIAGIGTLLLALTATVNIGCSRVDSAGAATSAPPTNGGPVTQGSAARPSSARGHSMNLAGIAIPDAPVGGRVGPRAFALSRVDYSAMSGAITFASADQQTVFVFPFIEGGIAGQKIRIERPSDEHSQPHVHMHFPLADGSSDTFVVMDGYVMLLEFGAERNGRVPGRIYLCTDDEHQSWIAGGFTVDVNDE